MLWIIQTEWCFKKHNLKAWIIPLKFFLTTCSVILRLSDISFARVIKAYLAFLDWDLMLSSTWWMLDDTGTRMGTAADPCKITEALVCTLCAALLEHYCWMKTISDKPWKDILMLTMGMKLKSNSSFHETTIAPKYEGTTTFRTNFTKLQQFAPLVSKTYNFLHQPACQQHNERWVHANRCSSVEVVSKYTMKGGSMKML